MMDWESRGIRYGTGKEIDYLLASGLSVVVKGSRAYLGEALRAYPDMTAIWVAAEPQTAAPRAGRRSRDSGSERGAHSGTGPAIRATGTARRIVHISNNTSLTPADEKLVSVLIGQQPVGVEALTGC
jgi:ribose 1,5-bisphosphokinase